MIRFLITRKLFFIVFWAVILSGIIYYQENIANNDIKNPKEVLNGQYTTVSQNAISYWMNHLGITNYQNKKVVIYPKPDNCPHGQAFIQAVEQAKGNPEFTRYYTFKQRNGMSLTYETTENSSNTYNEEREKFLKACALFCIVDYKKGTVYGINGVNERKAKAVQPFLKEIIGL